MTCGRWLYENEKTDPVIKKALDMILKEATEQSNKMPEEPESSPDIGDSDSIY